MIVSGVVQAYYTCILSASGPTLWGLIILSDVVFSYFWLIADILLMEIINKRPIINKYIQQKNVA